MNGLHKLNMHWISQILTVLLLKYLPFLELVQCTDRDYVTYQHVTEESTNGITLLLINRTTSSIAVKWDVNRTFTNESFIGYEVEYYISDGTFTSKRLPSWSNEFVLSKLMVNADYKICIKAYILKPDGVSTQIRCSIYSTLSYIRSDGIMALLLSFGYLIGMSLIGYIQWRRKKAATSIRRYPTSSIEESTELSANAVRWRDLPELEHLQSEARPNECNGDT